MGRPIKKKYFGDVATGGIGGEGVATIAKNNTGTLYTTSTTIALSFTAPQLAGGVAATGEVATNSLGNVATVTLSTAGSGYTSTPTATVVGGTTGTVATFTITLTSSNTNAIAGSAYIPGGSSALAFDIVKQESSRRYRVTTADGSGTCKLVAAAPAEGEMTIIATDSANGTYYVKKLTARKAVLVSIDGTEFTSGTAVSWNLTGAVLNTSVILANA
jgi:hypothetical protein